jgi:hypothetical protein
MERRRFIQSMAAVSAATIVPRHVLGGPGYVAPSDRLNLAQIGCGTQALRQVNAGLLARPELRFTCVCDPNRDSTDYVDWSRHLTRDAIRRFLGDPSWGEGDDGIRAGRDVARGIIETYYGRENRSGGYRGVRAYADFRELLDRETDLDGVVVITPDHTHAAIATVALRQGRAVICHKPVSNVWHEVRATLDAARTAGAVTHLLAYRDHADLHRLAAWLDAGVIGHVREVHNWTYRPVWPQGWLDYPTDTPPVPAGLDWPLWLGPEPDRPYHPNYTHALYRGWFAFGGGSFGDMGNYSLWPIFRLLELGVPTSVEGAAGSVAFVDSESVSRYRQSQVAYPMAGTLHFRHAARGARPPVDLFWYEGGIRPRTPEELYATGEAMPREGMLLVGEHGRILCNFRGFEPRLLPASRMAEVAELGPPADLAIVDADDEWIQAMRNGGRSRGDFGHIAALAEATALGGVAMRVPGKRLDWDASRGTFTNAPEAEPFLRREYRPGWEM